MTAKDIYNKLLTDPKFLVSTVVTNNYYDVVTNLESLGYEFITSRSQAIELLHKMLEDPDNVSIVEEVINVPYIKGGSHSSVDEAYKMLQDEIRKKEAAAEETGLRIDPVTISALAGAVGNLIGGLFNKGDEPTSSNTLAMQQAQISAAEEERRRKRQTWIVLGLVGLLLTGIIMYFIFRK